MLEESTDKKIELISEYYRLVSNNKLPIYAPKLFVKSVKQGEIELAKLVESQIKNEQDPIYLLYKGRFLSQIDETEQFVLFFNEHKDVLSHNASLQEGILPLIWRMGINSAKKNELKQSEYFFDMHNEMAIISKHELAHYYQCYGALQVMSGNLIKANTFLSEALNIYFKEFERQEEHYSVIDNIRCIIMNLLLQGIMDLQVNNWDIAYKKFTFCKLWFSKTKISKYASGISEIVTLVARRYDEVIKYVFSEVVYNANEREIAYAIASVYDSYTYIPVYDIHFILRACIDINTPIKKIKYIFLEDLKMQSKKVFVVEGRNKDINKAMYTFLTAIGLSPMEWEQTRKLTNKGTPYIGEILDKAFQNAQAIIVLLTPDEKSVLVNSLQSEKNDNLVKYQPRPNVIFEAGAALAHNPDRTILVSVGNVELWSDIDGRHVIRMDNSPQKRQALVERLKTAGCEIDLDGKTQWYDQGDFTINMEEDKEL